MLNHTKRNFEDIPSKIFEIYQRLSYSPWVLLIKNIIIGRRRESAAKWVTVHLKSPTTQPIAQTLHQAFDKGNTKAVPCWPFRNPTVIGGFPSQMANEAKRVMTSSCFDFMVTLVNVEMFIIGVDLYTVRWQDGGGQQMVNVPTSEFIRRATITTSDNTALWRDLFRNVVYPTLR